MSPAFGDSIEKTGKRLKFYPGAFWGAIFRGQIDGPVCESVGRTRSVSPAVLSELRLLRRIKSRLTKPASAGSLPSARFATHAEFDPEDICVSLWRSFLASLF